MSEETKASASSRKRAAKGASATKSSTRKASASTSSSRATAKKTPKAAAAKAKATTAKKPAAAAKTKAKAKAKAKPIKKAAAKTTAKKTTKTTKTTTTKKKTTRATRAPATAKAKGRAKAAEQLVLPEVAAAPDPTPEPTPTPTPTPTPEPAAAKGRRVKRTRRPTGELGPYDFPESWSPKLRELFDLGRKTMRIEHLRPGQAEALEHILAGRDVLAVMPTGSGKSLLYQLPSLVLPGVTVVVSPLIALIKDQVDKMKALGVKVCRIDSTLTTKQRREMDAMLAAKGGKLLLTTPERMADPEFRELLRQSCAGVGVSLFVVDEAHCVSHWGHDFRPSYLTVRKALEELGRPPVLATTATAPPHVRDDILHQMGMPDANIITTSFDRPNLHYEVIAVPGEDDKRKTLLALLRRLPRPGIVYCATVKAVEDLSEWLARHGLPVTKYHGRMTKKQRDEQQHAFMPVKSDKVMIATNAFGLGVDKPDIRYVLHYHVPGSLEAYAQEAGRGGRDNRPARCVLLFSPDDVAIQEYFLKGTYPSRRQVRAVVKALEAWDEQAPAGNGNGNGEEGPAPPTFRNIALASGVGAQRARTVLSLLKDEGFVVEREDTTWALSDPPPDPAALAEKAKQYEARRIADRQRLDALLGYVGTPGCRSQVILSYLGEVEPPVCGRCDNDLRSKEAAVAAAREATRLELSVTDRIAEADGELEEAPRRVIRHRVVSIDEPEPAAETPAPAEPEPLPPLPEPPIKIEPPPPDSELAELIADQASDDDGYEWEYIEGDEEFEDDEEYVYGPEEYVVEEIDKTAAALAEEDYTPEDAEITILKRKQRVKEPPKPVAKAAESAAAAAAAAAARKKRRRRRRRKKALLPNKAAFTSPVLQRPEAPGQQRPRHVAKRNASAAPGPVVEYVRGSMRINSSPVASATPNDVAPQNRSKRRRPFGGGGGGPQRRPGGGGPRPQQQRPPQPQPQPQAAGAPAPQPPRPPAEAAPQHGGPRQPGQPDQPEKKRRRRRRRRGNQNGGGPRPQQTQQAPASDAPVSFFSVAWSGGGGGGGGGGGNGNRKKKRRRRRRRGKGSGNGNGPQPPAPNPSPEG